MTMAVELNPAFSVELSDEAAHLASAFGSSMMDAGELLHLGAVLVAHSWQPNELLVEIGAYRCETTVFMAKLLDLVGQRVPILSIDAFERAQPDSLNPQGIYRAYIQNIMAHGVADKCFLLSAFSENAAPVVPNSIGVLVIDGGHHYPVVSKDLALYGAKVVPEGFVFIDDYVEAYPGVVQAVDEYFQASSDFEILMKSYFVVARRRPVQVAEPSTPEKVKESRAAGKTRKSPANKTRRK